MLVKNIVCGEVVVKQLETKKQRIIANVDLTVVLPLDIGQAQFELSLKNIDQLRHWRKQYVAKKQFREGSLPYITEEQYEEANSDFEYIFGRDVLESSYRELNDQLHKSVGRFISSCRRDELATSPEQAAKCFKLTAARLFASDKERERHSNGKKAMWKAGLVAHISMIIAGLDERVRGAVENMPSHFGSLGMITNSVASYRKPEEAGVFMCLTTLAPVSSNRSGDAYNAADNAGD